MQPEAGRQRQPGYTPSDMKITSLLLLAVLPSFGQAPVFEIRPVDSKILFEVRSSVKLAGVFNKWEGTLKFTSNKAVSGRLEIKIDAASVNLGSSVKEKTLRGEDFFDVKKNPTISFVSNKVVPVDENRYRIEGTFTIRGVSKPEVLNLTVQRAADGQGGRIQGTMAFDRRDYGMNHGIPFIKIADRVEVTVDLVGRRISGPPIQN